MGTGIEGKKDGERHQEIDEGNDKGKILNGLSLLAAERKDDDERPDQGDEQRE
jgi:hypothetical protein